MPVPDRLRRNISSLAMVSERADGTFALLSSNVRLNAIPVSTVCGALSRTVGARRGWARRFAVRTAKPDSVADPRSARYGRQQSLQHGGVGAHPRAEHLDRLDELELDARAEGEF